MGTRSAATYRMAEIAASGLTLVIFVGGCATADVRSVQITVPPASKIDLTHFSRVLVAGFVADRTDQIDLNQDTGRVLRTQLRNKASLQVIESETLRLADVPRPSASPLQARGTTFQPSDRRSDLSDSQESDSVFTNTAFWKRLGEEYSEPLILTGTVVFKPVAPRYEERTVGRGTVRLSRPGFSLRLRLVLISGMTGEIIDSVPLQRVTAHATADREGALSLYFKLMDGMMPSILGALGQRTSQTRVLLK